MWFWFFQQIGSVTIRGCRRHHTFFIISETRIKHRVKFIFGNFQRFFRLLQLFIIFPRLFIKLATSRHCPHSVCDCPLVRIYGVWHHTIKPPWFFNVPLRDLVELDLLKIDDSCSPISFYGYFVSTASWWFFIFVRHVFHEGVDAKDNDIDEFDCHSRISKCA